MNFTTLNNNIRTGIYDAQAPAHAKRFLPPDYILDKTKTWEENRDMVQEHNHAVEMERTTWIDERIRKEALFRTDAIAAISEDFGLNKESSTRLFEKVNSEAYTCGHCVVAQKLDNMAQFINKIILAERK